MSQRVLQKDTPADIQLRACIEAKPSISFSMVAGAGSGKTTSLVKSLDVILKAHGKKLTLYRQKVACITYTEIAAGEIWADVGNNPLVHVSTIHSFLWTLVKSFQSDITEWVKSNIEVKISELQTTAANFGSRVKQATREKNAREILRYQKQRAEFGKVKSFRYGTGSDYLNGVLGHDDVIKIGCSFLMQRKLMRTLTAQQFPFLFIDESQDTFPDIVQSVMSVKTECPDNFCLGFFGDPMQRIYPNGIGKIEVPAGWNTITKPENFRCPSNVLSVANAIRRDGDGLTQIPGKPIAEGGSVSVFICPIDDQRLQRLIAVKRVIGDSVNDPKWVSDSGEDVKVLVIVHRMAATRLGFGGLYTALNDDAPESFRNGFLDASAWPIRPFVSFLIPLADAALNGQDFAVMQILRAYCPLLQPDKVKGVDLVKLLAELGDVVEEFTGLLRLDSTATVRDVLAFVSSKRLFELDVRLNEYVFPRPVHLPTTTRNEDEEPPEEDDLAKEVSAMDAFLNCRASEFWGYVEYFKQQSPFSTQQGVKGAEFERVLVVLDDDEGTHFQFSYDKYLGLKPLSDRDLQNRAEGKETSVERTRRLFYVCCTRAMKDLGVVLFTANPEVAQQKLVALDIFPSEHIHILQ